MLFLGLQQVSKVLEVLKRTHLMLHKLQLKIVLK
ncbi:UNVERIFIED_CONTAM: hypothetical protein GTU68_002106 [Idotea baltica]|nr:hypothetical protein [Idotea baltica]